MQNFRKLANAGMIAHARCERILHGSCSTAAGAAVRVFFGGGVIGVRCVAALRALVVGGFHRRPAWSVRLFEVSLLLGFVFVQVCCVYLKQNRNSFSSRNLSLWSTLQKRLHLSFDLAQRGTSRVSAYGLPELGFSPCPSQRSFSPGTRSYALGPGLTSSNFRWVHLDP